MAATAHEHAVRVAVAADRSIAELIISPGMDRAMLTPDLCEALLQQAGVEVNEATRRMVEALFAEELPPGRVQVTVARAQPPVHGVDGHIEWLVESPAESLDTDARTSENYYDISAFVMVQRGQVIGRLHPPTPGRDGRDVTGKTLAARSGGASRCKLDETILCDATGRLIAQEQGVLMRCETSAFIRQVLEVVDYVDFSTGNIDFHGDVIVSKGVRDLFTVKATANVEVVGLIEAATIVAGKDLIARGGFAGRERGVATCGADFKAKYIDNIRAEVARDLTVDREIINCELTVHGSITSPHSVIIGGRIVVAGRIHVGMIGSGANVPTQIVVGSVPRLEPLFDRLCTFVEKVSTRHEELLAQQQQLNRSTGTSGASPVDRERQTELMFQIDQAAHLLNKAQATQHNLEQRIEAQRTIDIAIERKLFPGVIIAVGRNHYRLNTEVRGRLHLTKDDTGRLAFQRADGSRGLLVQIADVVAPDVSRAA